MPDKYIIEEGLVDSLALDISRTQEVIANNAERCLKTTIKKCGLKFKNENDFLLSGELHYIFPSHEGTITCRDMNVVVFKDYTTCDPSDREVFTTIISESPTWQGYIILSYATVYSNEGTYEEGYPESPGPEGNNVVGRKILTLETSNTQINNGSHITMAEVKITASGTFSILTDYRIENSMVLLNSQDVRIIPCPVNVSMETIFQSRLLKEYNIPGYNTNAASPSTNLTANQLFLKLMWDAPERTVWGYEYMLIPERFSSSGVNTSIQIRDIIIPNKEQDNFSVLIPAIEGVKYSLFVRSLGEVNHRPSPWTDPVTLICGTDKCPNTLESPNVTAIIIHENPHIIRITCDLGYTPPTPHRFQIRQKALEAQSPVMIHNGGPMTTVFSPQGDSPWFSARIVGPGKVCSNYSEWAPASAAISPPATGAFTMAFPIFAKVIVDNSDEQSGFAQCAKFWAPSPGVQITNMHFVSHGSYYVSPQGSPAPNIAEDDFWLQLEPDYFPYDESIPDSSKAKLYITDWYNTLTGALHFTYPSVDSDYNKVFAYNDYSGNLLPTDTYSPNLNYRLMLRYDHIYSSTASFMAIVMGTVFITMEHI